MRWQDRAALIAIAEAIAEHMEATEDKLDRNVLPSDRVRGAIHTLSEITDDQ